MRVRRDNEEFEVGDRIPVLPLRDVVVFPYMIIPLLVGRAPSLKALESAGAGDRMILALTQRGSDVEEPGPGDLHRVGTLCRILQLLRLPDGTMRVLVEGIARFRVTRFLRNPEAFFVRAAPLDENHALDAEIEALLRNARSRFEEYVRHHRRIPNEILISVNSVDEPRRLVHVMAAHLASRLEVKQELLETTDLRAQLVLLASHLSEELEILGIERKIEGEVRSQVQKSQREFWLTEQLKAIRKELGEPGEGGSDAEELEELVKRARMPSEVEKKALREVERLRRMAPLSPEATVVRTYVDWLIALPWRKRTRDRLDLDAASRILNEDHYGLEKAKERILEYLAVLKLVGHMKGPILCLVGPPGVGKTSLGQSVARAMGRKFVRVSLGGVRDEAEIRGHRRTYIGSMPGRIIQRLRAAGTRNPVFLLDEVDKLASDYRGDPAAALLEVLDPEQNASFSDHYLDVEFDLSEVLFIATANVMNTIPPALRDRMEILRLPGYQEYEKVHIASGFLVPKNLKGHGLSPARVSFSEPALRTLIRSYTREAGVRSLEREIASICRKVARQTTSAKSRAGRAARTRDGASDGRRARRISSADVGRFLGVARFTDVEMLPESLVGVASGLAWTEVGGEVLRVEVVKLPGIGRLTLTGKLGKVMQESGRAALTFARTRAAKLGLAPDFYKKLDFHVHIPEGAIPKDGPSAGVTMAVAVVSALSGIAVRRDVALTGEVTLTGEVLPVGGLNEKLVAARRAGFRTIVLPYGNRKDLPELPRLLTRGVEFKLVKTVDEALSYALVSDPATQRQPQDAPPVSLPGGTVVPPVEPPPGLAH